jgi:hypothetical protein
MRITEVRIYSKSALLADGSHKMATSVAKELDSTIVGVVTDEKRPGWGEICPIGPIYQPQHMLGARAAMAEMAPNDRPRTDIDCGSLARRSERASSDDRRPQ